MIRLRPYNKNDADIIPKTKHIPAIGDMMVEATIGIILSGPVGSVMPERCA